MSSEMTANIKDLPDELLIIVMKQCNVYDLTAIGGTCRRLHALSQRDCLWERICQKVITSEKVDLGAVSSYRELYTKLLHKYGQLIGLYQTSVGPFGGLTEVRFKDGTVQGITWDPDVGDVDQPLKHNILFILKPGETLTDGLHCVCLPHLAPHHGSVKLGKKKGSFSLLCFSPDIHAEAVWNDFGYEKHTFDNFHQRHGSVKNWKSHLFFKWQLKCHEQKLLCLRYKFDFCMDHKPLILPQLDDIPEALLTPEGHCPKQLISPGLFKGSDDDYGTQLVLLKYEDEKILHAYKVTGDTSVPAGEVIFSVELEYPIILDENEVLDEEDEVQFLQDLEFNKQPIEGPIYDLPEQAFHLPDGCVGNTPVDWCYGRFHGLGKDRGCATPVHVMVFNQNTLGVLWLEMKCLTICKRVLQSFSQQCLKSVHSVL